MLRMRSLRVLQRTATTSALARRALSSNTSSSSATDAAAVANLTATEAFERFNDIPGFRAYPHAFPVTHSFKQYQEQYSALEPKARETHDTVALAGTPSLHQLCCVTLTRDSSCSHTNLTK